MRTSSLVAMAVGSILGVGRSAVAQDPTTADGYGRADDEEISTLGRLCNCGTRAGRCWLDRFRGSGPILDRCRVGPKKHPVFRLMRHIAFEVNERSQKYWSGIRSLSTRWFRQTHP